MKSSGCSLSLPHHQLDTPDQSPTRPCGICSHGNYTSRTFYFWIASNLCRFHEDLYPYKPLQIRDPPIVGPRSEPHLYLTIMSSLSGPVPIHLTLQPTNFPMYST